MSGGALVSGAIAVRSWWADLRRLALPPLGIFDVTRAIGDQAAPSSGRTRNAVLYVINTLSRGGAERGLATLIENGLFREADLTVFVFARGDGGLRRRMIDLVGEDRLIEVTGDDRLTVSGMLRGALMLTRLIRELRPDAVVLSLKQANILGRSVLLLDRETTCVAFEHMARLEREPAGWLYELVLRLLSRRVDHVWADCPTTLEKSRRYYPWRRQRTESVVPLFIARPERRKRDYRIVGPIRLVMAGRLIRRKRFDVAVDALALLKARGIEARCTIFGVGPEAGSILARARAANVADRLTLAGFAESWWRPASEHDIFLQASEEEGLCLVAAEAMMVGLPTVTTVVGGLNDYSLNGENAVHVPIGDAPALADAIARLAADEPRRRRLGMAAAETIAQLYAPETAQRHYGEATRALAGKKSQGPARIDETH